MHPQIDQLVRNRASCFRETNSSLASDMLQRWFASATWLRSTMVWLSLKEMSIHSASRLKRRFVCAWYQRVGFGSYLVQVYSDLVLVWFNYFNGFYLICFIWALGSILSFVKRFGSYLLRHLHSYFKFHSKHHFKIKSSPTSLHFQFLKWSKLIFTSNIE